ncbi:MAG: peptidyl-prolyl cis-trans isomerase [Gammaproteobacteria bacterium]
MNRLLTCFLAAALFLAAGCGRDEQTAVAIATIDGEALTADDLTTALLEMPRTEQLEYLTEPGKRVLVDLLIDGRLAADAARRLSLGTASDLPKDVELTAAYVRHRRKQRAPPSEEEMRRYYEDHPQLFATPERIRVERIFFESRDRAESARAELIEQNDLSDYRLRHADEKIRIDSIWLQRREHAAEFEAVAFGLASGKLSEPVKMQIGYALMRVIDRQDAGVPPFDEVRPRVRAMLGQQGDQALLNGIRAELREGVDVVIDEAALAYYTCVACVQ